MDLRSRDDEFDFIKDVSRISEVVNRTLIDRSTLNQTLSAVNRTVARLDGSNHALKNYNRFFKQLGGLNRIFENSDKVITRLGGLNIVLENHNRMFTQMGGLNQALDDSTRVFRQLGGLNRMLEKSHYLRSSSVLGLGLNRSENSFLTTGSEQIKSVVGVEIDRVSKVVSDVVDEKIDPAIIEICKKIDSSRDSKFKIFLFTILFPLLINYITDMINPYLLPKSNESSVSDKKIIKKELSQKVKAIVPFSFIRDKYRFVNCDILNVRLKPTTKSAVVGRFNFSQVVEIKQKKRNWTLVCWSDPESDVVIQGWVFTRYLKKFK
ncbi:hypothetical protein DF185_11050 [Marinifilum breve]|uniref:SH3b domain-containing protein n=1 Tax=Marinifilum breve TaxID=2184082 RepID=A0A2V3ZXK3_9BACT|nr:SH3 domain-containing protein [Marinifilum breve]PXY01179.1 hypothetical protein DF185_11050 [Marinifilum breve]